MLDVDLQLRSYNITLPRLPPNGLLSLLTPRPAAAKISAVMDGTPKYSLTLSDDKIQPVRAGAELKVGLS